MADDDLDILAWTMLGEAGGEGRQGMADVASVVLNRANSGQFPDSIQEVALQPNQFSTWNSGNGGNDPKGRYPKESAAFQQARRLAEQVVAGEVQGPPGRPLFYHAPSVTPYWRDSVAQNGAIERNGHIFYPSVPVPPGELPEVGTLQDTRRTPSPVTPVTATPDMAMMRRAAAPSQLIPDTFGRILPRVPRQPLAADMRATQANPATPFLNRDGQGITDPANIALFGPNPDYQSIGRLPTTPVPASVEDRVTARNRVPSPVGLPPSTRTVQSVPVLPRPQVSASDLARGRSGISTVASIPTTTPPVMTIPRPTATPLAPQFTGITASDRVRAAAIPNVPTRLAAGGNLPPLPGTISPQQVAQIGLPAVPSPMAPRTMVASAAPMPRPRPNFMPQVATQLATTPMPPLPIPRPPVQQAPARAPLKITVNGGNPVRPPVQQVGAVQQFVNQGLSRADAYDAANRAAAQRARENASSPSHQSTNSWFNEVTGR